MSGRFSRPRLGMAIWLLWAVALIAVYYRQLWSLFLVGPVVWLESNASLGVAWALRDLVKTGWASWDLPFWPEALWRAATAMVACGLLLTAAQVLGAGACRLLRWHSENGTERFLYRTAAGLGGLSYLSLGLAWLGAYSVKSIQVLVALVLAGGALWFVAHLAHGLGRRKPPARRNAAPAQGSRRNRVWKAIVLVAVLIALTGALAPEREYDALGYHLYFPRLSLQKGFLVDLPWEVASLYPMAWELIFGAGLALGGPVAAKLLHFSCLLLTGALVYLLTRRFVPRGSPWAAVAFFITVPTVLWEATTAYIDLALTVHAGLAIYALLYYLQERGRSWLGLAALNLGLALGTKHLAFFVLLLAAAGLAAALWRRERNLRRALMPAVLLVFFSLLLPLPWYVRSWLATGNPFFPELFALFGGPPERWDAVAQEGLNRFLNHFGSPRTLLHLALLPWDVTVHGARYGGALGPVFLLLLPLVALLRRYGRNLPLLMIFAVLYLLLWALPVSSFQMRFLMPITPLLAVAAADAYSRIGLLLQSSPARWGRPALQYGMAGLLLLNLPPFTSLHEVDRAGWDGWLTHVLHEVPVGAVIGKESEQDYLARSVASYAAWSYVNGRLAPQVRLLTFTDGDQFYSERERIWSNATIARPGVWGARRGEERRAFAALRRLGISHVLFDKRELASLGAGGPAIAEAGVRSRWYQLEYEDHRFVLYRILWEAMPLQGAT